MNPDTCGTQWKAIVEACAEAFGTTFEKIVDVYSDSIAKKARSAAMMLITDRYSHSYLSIAPLFNCSGKTAWYNLERGKHLMETDHSFACTVEFLYRTFMPWLYTDEVQGLSQPQCPNPAS